MEDIEVAIAPDPQAPAPAPPQRTGQKYSDNIETLKRRMRRVKARMRGEKRPSFSNGDVRFGNVLRDIREMHGFTIRAAAKALGVHVDRISRLENARCRPQPELVEAIERLYEMEPGELMEMEAQPRLPEAVIGQIMARPKEMLGLIEVGAQASQKALRKAIAMLEAEGVSRERNK